MEQEVMMQLTAKRKGVGLEMKSFTGASGTAYLVLRTGPGSYHVFAEVEAKEAARDCGSTKGANTRSEWNEIWEDAENSN
jgi:hypothetical protein